MKFYKGYMYDVWTAVYPEEEKVRYQILEVKSWKKRRSAYIKVGYGRELEVNNNAKLLWMENKEHKIIDIPFTEEEGRFVFDLPEFLTKRNIPFTLQGKTTNCIREPWNRVACPGIISSAGLICWGGEARINEYEYWLSVSYQRNYPEIGGRSVECFRFDRKTSHMNMPEILLWFQNSMENRVQMTYEELGELFSGWGIDKESLYTEIRFYDGSCATGNDIWGTVK